VDPTVQQELRDRTRQFAVRTLKLCRVLGDCKGEGWILRDQILRSATSVAANYRAACRARSLDEFGAKLSIVVEEADETLFWFELLEASATFSSKQLKPLMQEATELLKIFVAARRTTRAKIDSRNSKSEMRN
jgi:four helix bundle protein